MASTDRHLVREQDGIILLLTPPFDKMTPSPGYIQGYVPGVRENGGQYTHAALWTVLAFAPPGRRRPRARRCSAMLNPDQPRARSGERRALPRRALRRRRGRLLAGPPRRPRRLDVVHGIGGLDVPGRRRGAARHHPAARRAAHRPVHPEHVEGTTRSPSDRPAAEFHISVENPDGVCRGVRSVTRWTDASSRPADPARRA